MSLGYLVYFLLRELEADQRRPKRVAPSRGRATVPLITVPRCPHDASVLGPLFVVRARSHVALHKCRSCRGQFLPGAEVGRLARTPAPWRIFDPDGVQTPTTGVRCPGCGFYARPLASKDVVLDVCGECGGVWFDDGEWQAVRAQRLLDEPGTILNDAAPPSPARRSGRWLLRTMRKIFLNE